MAAFRFERLAVSRAGPSLYTEEEQHEMWTQARAEVIRVARIAVEEKRTIPVSFVTLGPIIEAKPTPSAQYWLMRHMGVARPFRVPFDVIPLHQGPLLQVWIFWITLLPRLHCLGQAYKDRIAALHHSSMFTFAIPLVQEILLG